MLYQVLIYPIEIIIEMIYYMFDKISNNPGISIIGVSIALQILTLPLYNIAEKWQLIERQAQQAMKPKVDKIKAVFKGDEQYMILSTYYKQNHYHPIFAMRSTIGLVIQIPFFIAAYTFLSNLEVIKGSSFLFIPNLGEPDALFSPGSITINFLPIIMTLINIIASLLYTKGFPLREKIQLHVMALLFLVLLYNSPSALVLYWTLNNIFSLVKNLVYKLKNPLKFSYIIASILLACVTVYACFLTNMYFARKIFLVLITLLTFSLPLIVYFFNNFITPKLTNMFSNLKQRTILFLLSCTGLFLLAGVFIPSALTTSSTDEFSFIGNYSSPLDFLVYPLYHGFGIFLVWLPLIYTLFSQTIKNILAWIISSLFVICIVYSFVIIVDYGFISNTLQFETEIPLIPAIQTLLIDSIVVSAIFILVFFLLKIKATNVIIPIYAIASSTLLVLGISNYIITQKNYNEIVENVNTSNNQTTIHSLEPKFNLSTNNQNVMVIMLDMAIGGFVQHIFNEFPETKKQFDGFIEYPNAVTLASVTALGAFPPYGGYEYGPDILTTTSNDIIGEKTSEAIAVLPEIFSQNGYVTSIINSPLGYGGSNISDISNLHFENLDPSIYRNIWLDETNTELAFNTILEDSFILFSIFRMAPTSLKGGIYINGHYWKISDTQNNAYFDDFLNNYAVLSYLPQLTSFNEGAPSFIYLKNDTPHEPIDRKYVFEEESKNITNNIKISWDDRITYTYYNANVATFLELGSFFDFMRENNIYDNTRIILVSDHGTRVNIPEFSHFNTNRTFQNEAQNSNIKPELVNSLLMVKDFNSSDPITTNYDFMTNADVPYLATEDIVHNPVNPFTNSPIEIIDKSNGIDIEIVLKLESNKINESETWNVKDNIFEPENWSKVK